MADGEAMDAGRRLRIAVLGAGSVGCQLGGRLAPHAEVTLIGRAAAMAVLDEKGLRLTGGGQPETLVEPGGVRTAAGPEAVAGADCVLVTVKSAGTEAAARELAPHLSDGTVVVSFQNGLRNAETLRSVLGAERTVVAGMVPYNIVQTEPGTYHQGSGGELLLDAGPEAAPLAAVLRRAGLPAQQHPDMRGVQYAKLLMNLNNALNALSGLPLREQLGQRDHRRCLAVLQREALAAYRAAGIRPARLGLVAPRLTPTLLGLPDGVFRRVAASALAIDEQARSSMWEDLQRGRTTEIDSLQGEIVTLAARHGQRATANERLIALVREAESGDGRTRTGAELLAELTR
ncbi:2-dehydropantoate 2-reductase [Streptomyces tardus]|uniref:2-dehydropantoate 2-reductase n=1 Tax=Streptomyces tardus TaxID=2780544 RepID=UPI001F468D1E|nr:2-dehydropantoate 2-reductase [Streptomyces tardus]